MIEARSYSSTDQNTGLGFRLLDCKSLVEYIPSPSCKIPRSKISSGISGLVLLSLLERPDAIRSD